MKKQQDEIIHRMRGSLGVIQNFLNYIKSMDNSKDYREYHDAALMSLRKIFDCTNDLERNKLACDDRNRQI